MHYFFILLRHRDAVYASRLVNSVQHLQPNGLFRFPEEIVFEDLGSDVIITMEVYAVVRRFACRGNFSSKKKPTFFVT